MTDWGTLATGLILAAGGGIGLEKLASFLLGLITGRNGRRRDEVARAWMQADQERMRASRADVRRRKAEEHASLVRRMLIEAPCVPTDSIPPWPAPEPATGPIHTEGVS